MLANKREQTLDTESDNQNHCDSSHGSKILIKKIQSFNCSMKSRSTRREKRHLQLIFILKI